MKQIVMLVGIGNNDRGSARLASEFGRTVLIQDGPIGHEEVWENGVRTYNGPEVRTRQSRLLAEMTLGVSGVFRNLKNFKRLAQGARADLVITSAYVQTVAGLWLRLTGRAAKVVCIVSDYLPPRGSFAVRMHRRVTGFLTRLAARFSDEAWAVSPRIPTVKVNPHNYVLPLLIDDNQTRPEGRDEVGYIGFPSPDHAIDILFDVCRRHQFKLNIFGDSPYLQSIRHQAPPGTVFHGITNDNVKIGSVLARCFCGYAVYRDTSPNSYSYFGVPSKCLQLFASNVPVVTTNTAHFVQTIGQAGAGCVVEPAAEPIERAILDIRARYTVYFEAINRFRSSWNAGVRQFHRERIGALLEVAVPVDRQSREDATPLKAL
jgi:glycosyltransferase involved in cell wall biosynthesis